MRTVLTYYDRYDLNNTAMPEMRETKPRLKPREDVVEYLGNDKLCKPSIKSLELQQIRLLDGFFHVVDRQSKPATDSEL